MLVEHLGRHAQAQLERVDRVEERLLVLLEVLVVGERQAVQHAVERHQAPGHARRLRAQQLGGVRVLLLRHQARARRERVGHLAEAELLARPEHDLAAELREVGGAGGGGRQVVEHEVAVRDGVERVLRDAAEAELLGHEHAAGVEVDPGERAGAERQVVRGRHAEVEALEVAAELPEVGQQVVREVDRLGALQVRVAGQRPVEVALGQLHQRRHQVARAAPCASRLWARTSIATSVATWSLRERAVWSLPPAGAGDLGQPALDRHVDVLVVRRARRSCPPRSPRAPRRGRARSPRGRRRR